MVAEWARQYLLTSVKQLLGDVSAGVAESHSEDWEVSGGHRAILLVPGLPTTHEVGESRCSRHGFSKSDSRLQKV